MRRGTTGWCAWTGRTVLAALAVALLAAACAGESDEETTATEDPAADADPAAGESAAPARWTHFGHDHDNSRFNADELLLGPDEVGSLAPRWHVDDLGGMVSTPAVVDGVVYFGDWAGVAVAVDASDGGELWATELEGGPVMSSLTVLDDAVLANTSRGLTRLDRESGEVEWHVETTDHPLALAAGAPLVVDDLVVNGLSSGELMLDRDTYTFRGSLAAYDLDSGEEVWRTWMTEADETEGAGVGIWATPSVDHERGVLYIGTGNTYEPPQAELSNSILAVEVGSGEVIWSTQLTSPDVWSIGNPEGLDADVGAGPNLFTVDGRDLVGAGDKQGDYYALDRDTGEIVWETDLTDGSLLGGVMETAAHGEGRIFVASNVGDGDTNLPTGTSAVFALDERDGGILWETPLDGDVYAPVTLIPGVVFVATTAGTYHALTSDDGEELWTMEAPDQIGGGATVVDGVVYWGYGFSLFGGGGDGGGVFALATDGDEHELLAPGDVPGADHAGAPIYRSQCASCHGTRGQGAVGPELQDVEERLARDAQIGIVREGLRGQMPGFGDHLSEDEIEAVVDYTREEL